MLDDSRFRRWEEAINDVRLEVASVEENEGPPLALRHWLSELHSVLDAGIRITHYMQGRCTVCGGVGKVMRAAREGHGFNWLGGECIACPACSVIGVG